MLALLWHCVREFWQNTESKHKQKTVLLLKSCNDNISTKLTNDSKNDNDNDNDNDYHRTIIIVYHDSDSMWW